MELSFSVALVADSAIFVSFHFQTAGVFWSHKKYLIITSLNELNRQTILLQVTDANSHTPFVKLQNRMIVLLSRARLAMYVLGNVGYFESKPDDSIAHWQRTLDALRQPADQDTTPGAVNADLAKLTYTGPRLGPELPIWYSKFSVL